MWSRIVEVMLGCWLLVSPFVFHHTASDTAFWVVDLAAGSAVILCGLLSYVPRLRHAHLLTLGTALAMIAFAAVDSGAFSATGVHGPIAPAYQNHVVVALLLLMLALIPNHASQPPRSWTPDTSRWAHGSAGSD